MKWKVQRGCRASHCLTFGCLWGRGSRWRRCWREPGLHVAVVRSGEAGEVARRLRAALDAAGAFVAAMPSGIVKSLATVTPFSRPNVTP